MLRSIQERSELQYAICASGVFSVSATPLIWPAVAVSAVEAARVMPFSAAVSASGVNPATALAAGFRETRDFAMTP